MSGNCPSLCASPRQKKLDRESDFESVCAPLVILSTDGTVIAGRSNKSQVVVPHHYKTTASFKAHN